MRKLNSKKGFTIVELVIVIAVIAILAAVLIPTFSSVTQSAKASAAMQEAKSGLDAVLVLTEGIMPAGSTFYIGDKEGADYCFEYASNQLAQASEIKAAPIYDTASVSGTTVTTYSCYVAETAIKPDKNGLTDNVAALLADIIDTTGMNFSTSGNHYVLKTTDESKIINIYYTSDFNDTLIAFIADSTTTPAAPVVTETETETETTGA